MKDGEEEADQVQGQTEDERTGIAAANEGDIKALLIGETDQAYIRAAKEAQAHYDTLDDEEMEQEFLDFPEDMQDEIKETLQRFSTLQESAAEHGGLTDAQVDLFLIENKHENTCAPDQKRYLLKSEADDARKAQEEQYKQELEVAHNEAMEGRQELQTRLDQLERQVEQAQTDKAKELEVQKDDLEQAHQASMKEKESQHEQQVQCLNSAKESVDQRIQEAENASHSVQQEL